MIAPNTSHARHTAWHPHFVSLLPAIRRHAEVSFRHLKQEAREEAVQEVIAHAVQAFVRLWERDRCELAYAAPFARFGVCRVREGRGVGGRSDARDVMSINRQRRSGISVERLHEFDALAGGWKEIVVEDRRASPSDIAAMRIDFADWLDALCGRNRHVAETLAAGEQTSTWRGCSAFQRGALLS